MKNSILKYILFAGFAVLLLLKALVFHWAIYHTIPVSSLWNDTLYFFQFYGIKMFMPCFIASFVLLTKRWWWTAIVALLTDIWCVANIIYYKSYNLFLSFDTIKLFRNMDSAWDSILIYLDWSIWFLLIGTMLWIGILVFVRYYIIHRVIPTHTHSAPLGVFILLNLIIFSLSVYNNYKEFNTFTNEEDKEMAEAESIMRRLEHANDSQWYRRYMYQWVHFPYGRDFYNVQQGDKPEAAYDTEAIVFVKKHSILAYFPSIFVRHFCKPSKETNNKYITSEEKENLVEIIKHKYAMDDTSHTDIPATNLVIILVESFEAWTIEKEISGVDVCPFIRALTANEHVLFCPTISSQAYKGNSGDGQMIINSGLLPLETGVACMDYGNNVYPNIAHFYTESMIVNPWPHIWNQDTMTIRYGYKQLIETKGDQWTDRDVFDAAIQSLCRTEAVFCCMCITEASHSPFNRIKNDRLDFEGKNQVPLIMDKYLNALNYTDSCIAALCQYIWSTPKLQNTTIVITGDHTLFKGAMLYEYKDFINTFDLSLKSGENYCPLIIYSPLITQNSRIDEICYQMDIYPTILQMIGCTYYFQGFGENLMNREQLKNRRYTPQEAIDLSNKIILSDFFSENPPQVMY